MTLVEVAIGIALLALVAATAIASLTVLNKNATSTRVLTSVKEIVQRNIEWATAAPFTSTTEPAILRETTGATGEVWDEADGTNTASDQTNIYTSRDESAKVTGTLRRIVITEPNALSADIRRVTFHLDYKVAGRSQSYEMTTLRAMDR